MTLGKLLTHTHTNGKKMMQTMEKFAFKNLSLTIYIGRTFE